MTLGLDAALRWWVVRHHGEGAAHQDDVFRCEGCHRVITWRVIRQGGCRCGLSRRLRPARLTWGEALGLVLTPWRYR